MTMRLSVRRAAVLACALVTASATSAWSQARPLELRKGDHVVLLGNTTAERMQHFNHFETVLHARFPELQLVVRNIGWSADTITLQPRPLNFGDTPAHLAAQKADVILAFFGSNESFAGEAGLAQFEQELDAYLRAHLQASYNGRSAPRLALVSPIAHERLARLARVDTDARNRDLSRYTEAMRRVATQNGVPLVDLFTPTKQLMEQAQAPLTINGIHLNEVGDRAVSPILMAGLGFDVDGTRAASGPKLKTLESLRDLVADKNRQFFLRFRPSNAEYVVGRRLEPFGSVNFPPEMRELDELVAERDRQIWKRALDAQGLGYGDGAATRPSSAAAGRN